MSRQVMLTGIIDIKNILDLHIEMKPGCHGLLHAKTFLNEEEKECYSKIQTGCELMLVYMDSAETSPIFCGIITELEYKKCGYDYYEGKITLKTKSVLHDMEKAEKSFQDVEMTYLDVMESVAPIVSDSKINICIENPILQYMETAWDFVKRMSSRFGLNVYPDYVYGTDAIFVGLPSARKSVVLEISEYVMGFSANYHAIKNYKSSVTKEDYVYYSFNDTEYYKIGTEILFKGNKYFVYDVIADYIGEELIFTYQIGKNQIINVAPISNYNIVGRSIRGKVLSTAAQSVKVHLEIDKDQDQDKAYPFVWAPDSGNLMYCMPQKESMVVLYYGDTDEKPGKLIHCVRTNGDDVGLFQNSEEKYFVTEDNKQLVLLTEELKIDSDAKDEEKAHLKLHDTSGIEIKSDKVLDIVASEKIKIEANKVVMQAPLDITVFKPAELVCLDGTRENTHFSALDYGIKLNNQVDLVSKQDILMTYRTFCKYPPIQDAPQVFDNDKWMANIFAGLIGTVIGATLAVCAVALIAGASVATGGLAAVALAGLALGAVVTFNMAASDASKGVVSEPGQFFVAGLGGGFVGGIIFATSAHLGGALIKGSTTLYDVAIQKFLLGGSLAFVQTLLTNAMAGSFTDGDIALADFLIGGILSLLPGGLFVALFYTAVADITAVDVDGDGEMDAIDSMVADFLEWALQ